MATKKKMKLCDIRIDIFRYAIANSPCAMMLYHIPTGITVRGEGRIQKKLERELLKQLEQKVDEYEKKETNV